MCLLDKTHIAIRVLGVVIWIDTYPFSLAEAKTRQNKCEHQLKWFNSNEQPFLVQARIYVFKYILVYAMMMIIVRIA